MAYGQLGSNSSGANKSKAVREHHLAHPGDGPTAIAEKLAAQGITVKPAFVSTVLSNARRKAGDTKPSRSEPAAATDTVSLDSLLKAKKLIELVGGVGAAKAALEAYGQLVD